MAVFAAPELDSAQVDRGRCGHGDGVGEGVEAPDGELEVAGSAGEFDHLDRPCPEAVRQCIEAAGPVLGLLAHDHAYRDPVREPSGPDS